MQILGYFWNPISSDREVISAKVEELANMSELENFSYENILSIKNSGVGLNKKDPRIIMLESNRIPPYMIDFPKRKYKAKLYIDENVRLFKVPICNVINQCIDIFLFFEIKIIRHETFAVNFTKSCFINPGYFSVFMHNLIYSFAHYKSQFLFVYVIILSYKQPTYT